MIRWIKVIFVSAFVLAFAPVHAQEPTAKEQAQLAQYDKIQKGLHPASGKIAIPGTDAVLNLGEDYYYLPADEAKKVLVEGWGNPPDAVGDVLGMVLPKGKTFFDDTWGAVISFEATGYVSDDDAQSADYAALLKDMQSGEEDANKERVAQGYEAQHLMGWAETPVYDAKSHSVVWAQNIRFGNQTDNTLNYDVRLLGRRGVLSLNVVTSMSKLAETRAVAAKFAQSAAFEPGARYADFDESTDPVAEYGVAGLVAAGLGVAAAKKFGLLAIILAFGKKFLILIVGAVVALRGRIVQFFKRGKSGTDEIVEAPSEPAIDDLEPTGEIAAETPHSEPAETTDQS